MQEKEEGSKRRTKEREKDKGKEEKVHRKEKRIQRVM